MIAPKAILIVGGSGFIGTHLALRLRDRYKVFVTYHSNPVRIRGVTQIPMSITNRNWVKRVVYTVRPDVVIYAAGNNSAEAAEVNSREAENLHAAGAASVLNFSELFQAKFIYLSNCYAFDGQRGNYRETDVVLPVAALGKAKIGGENLIRGRSLNYVLLRSSPVFGRGNGFNLSFFDRLRMKLARGERIELPNHELHSFGWIEGLVELVDRLVGSGLRNRTIHYGGLTKVTHCELGRLFARRFGYDPSLVLPKKIALPKGGSIDSPVFDYSLNSTQVTETLKIQPLLLEECFDLIEKQLVVAS